MKSSRSAAKRFKKTGTGKITYHKAGRRHLLNKKSAKRKRSLRKQGIVSGPDSKRIGRLIPFK
jgi:large subunit ribosomal protein L35